MAAFARALDLNPEYVEAKEQLDLVQLKQLQVHAHAHAHTHTHTHTHAHRYLFNCVYRVWDSLWRRAELLWQSTTLSRLLSMQ